jgi:hypothetical protein
LNTSGLESFLDLMKYCTSIDLNDLNEEKTTLLTVCLGCLHNLTNENETLKKAMYDVKIMGRLGDFIPFLNKSRRILVYFGSCIENLTEIDEGKAQFVSEQLALKLYTSFDENIIVNLGEHADDFFTNLTELNEIGNAKFI